MEMPTSWNAGSLGLHTDPRTFGAPIFRGEKNGGMPARPTVTSRWSLWSEDSVLSVGSKGSVLSICSVGSVLSIGSVGSIASVLSIGSAASLGSAMSSASRWSLMSHRARRGVMTTLPSVWRGNGCV